MEETFRDVLFPVLSVPERAAPDLRLKKGSKTIDAGLTMPNINDDHNGKAPDTGAYEFGQQMPHYGPRL